MTEFQFGTSKLPPEVKLLHSSESSISEADLKTLIEGRFCGLYVDLLLLSTEEDPINAIICS